MLQWFASCANYLVGAGPSSEEWKERLARMSRTVLDDEEMSMPRSTARSGTSSVRSTSRSGRRPTSAPNRRKQGATSRPSSVKPGATGRLSRLQDINHPGVPPGIPDSLKPKRKTGPPSGKFFTDPENMYAEIQKLKKR